jgi:hypothetical protein
MYRFPASRHPPRQLSNDADRRLSPISPAAVITASMNNSLLYPMERLAVHLSGFKTVTELIRV